MLRSDGAGPLGGSLDFAACNEWEDVAESRETLKKGSSLYFNSGRTVASTKSGKEEMENTGQRESRFKIWRTWVIVLEGQARRPPFK